MIKKFNKKGKLVEVTLLRTEQHMLMKQNIKKLREHKLDELTALGQEMGDYDKESK